MFYTPNYDAAVKFAHDPQHELLIMTGWIILYWVLTCLATRGVKTFSNLAKYGVIIGSLIPLAVMVILAIVWVAQGHTPAIPMTPKGLIHKWNGMSTLALAAGVFFSYKGFVILLIQTITVLHMIYYILMFTAFLRLRHDQPNRPRSFKVPRGMVGTWIVAGVGLLSSAFEIVLAIYPSAQVKSEVGSPAVYVSVILILVAVILAICFALYQLSKHHDWINPDNEFAPFTWEIEGLKKPGKVLSNAPTTVMSEDQNSMEMPIKRPYKPKQQVSEHVVKADEDNKISTDES